jgi:hypothetical protein
MIENQREAKHVAAFASPNQHRISGIHGRVCSAYAAAVTRNILAKLASDPAQESLVRYLHRAATELEPNVQAWRPEFGIASQLERMPGGLVAAAAQCALGMNAIGIEGDWCATLTSPQRFVFADHMLKVEGVVHSKTSADLVTISTTTAADNPSQRATYLQRDDRWIGDGEFVPSNIDAIHGVFPLVNYASANAGNLWPVEEEMPQSWNAEMPAKCLHSAMKFVEEVSSSYESWIRRAIRIVIPVGQTGLASNNGSNQSRPGVVSISFPHSPVSLGEVLVHESSHQHFYMFGMFVRYCNTTDKDMFYSAIKKTERPFLALLLAYHAVANMIFYHRAVLSAGKDNSGFCELRLKQWIPMAEEYESTFDSNRDKCSEIGNLLWTGLAENLALK